MFEKLISNLPSFFLISLIVATLELDCPVRTSPETKSSLSSPETLADPGLRPEITRFELSPLRDNFSPNVNSDIC